MFLHGFKRSTDIQHQLIKGKLILFVIGNGGISRCPIRVFVPSPAPEKIRIIEFIHQQVQPELPARQADSRGLGLNEVNSASILTQDRDHILHWLFQIQKLRKLFSITTSSDSFLLNQIIIRLQERWGPVCAEPDYTVRDYSQEYSDSTRNHAGYDNQISKRKFRKRLPTDKPFFLFSFIYKSLHKYLSFLTIEPEFRM